MESKPIEWLTARCIQLFTDEKKGAKKRLLLVLIQTNISYDVVNVHYDVVAPV